jgi:tRNA-specific 2-thiouridylase
MRVVAGVSGGIDSAVACALLVEQGHEVICLHLSFHGADTGTDRAREVARRLGLTFLEVSVRDEFEKEVLNPFTEEWSKGLTPNPCVICNRRVKFPALVDAASKEGANAVATGHYARTAMGPGGRISLFRGIDRLKDQSYMLYRLPPETLPALLFPLGEMTKEQVSGKGRTLFPDMFDDLPESEDLCFLPDGELAEYIQGRAGPFPEGDVIDPSGKVAGKHRGLNRYTVGQRKGLGLSGGPWFVTGIDSFSNRIFVGREEDLAADLVKCRDSLWHEKPVPGKTLEACKRYRSRPVECTLVSVEGGSFTCLFPGCISGAAPGQSLVLYSGDRVYGGGIIETALRGGP